MSKNPKKSKRIKLLEIIYQCAKCKYIQPAECKICQKCGRERL